MWLFGGSLGVFLEEGWVADLMEIFLSSWGFDHWFGPVQSTMVDYCT